MSLPKKWTGPDKFRHQHGLEADILADGLLRNKSTKRKSRSDDAEQDGFVDARSSKKILRLGRELQDESKANEEALSKPAPISSFDVASRIHESSDASDDESHGDEEDAWLDEDSQVIATDEINPHDLDSFNRFIPNGAEPTLDAHAAPKEDSGGTNLADLILEQIAAHESALTRQQSGDDQEIDALPPKVVEVYTKVGMILSRYKSGRLPKPFKIIPSLAPWREVLVLTKPEAWTPNACYQATRLFISANVKMAQEFIEMILLERAREEIHETKKLNVHLYQALKKATYRPAAFFKGLIFPLVESTTCTLREAHIISSVIARVSIPALHSAAALMRLTDIAAEQASASTEGGGATNIFIRTLLEKKYALPYRVVDNLVFHFLRFRTGRPSRDGKDTDIAMDDAQTSLAIKLPVLWHQSLLAFAQRYRNDITEDQREALLDLLTVCGHKDIGPEVRRELLAGRGRGTVIEEEELAGGDDTMVISGD